MSFLPHREISGTRDMFMAFIGANLSQLILSKVHDRQIERLDDAR